MTQYHLSDIESRYLHLGLPITLVLVTNWDDMSEKVDNNYILAEDVVLPYQPGELIEVLNFIKLRKTYEPMMVKVDSIEIRNSNGGKGHDYYSVVVRPINNGATELLINSYISVFKTAGVESKEDPDNCFSHEHLLWMMEHCKASDQTLVTKHRWIAWVQCCLVHDGTSTLEYQRNLTRSIVSGL